MNLQELYVIIIIHRTLRYDATLFGNILKNFYLMNEGFMNNNDFFSIGEVAKAVGITRKTMDYFLKISRLIVVRKYGGNVTMDTNGKQ